LGIRLAGAGVALSLQICLARMLGHAGYGQYAFVFAWLQLMLLFAQGGFSVAALRYLAEYRARREPSLLRGFLRRSSQIALGDAVVLALVMAGCAMALGRSGAEGTTYNFLIASAALPALSQLALAGATVRGLGFAIPGMLVGLVHPILLLGTLLIVVHSFPTPISPSHALLLNLAAAVGALGLVLAMRRRVERGLHQGSVPEFRTREWLSTATQMMIVSSLIYLQGRTGVLISGLLLDTHAAGTYAAMERVADVVLLGLTSVNLLVAPDFAALHAQGRRLELERHARLAAWGATTFMLVTLLPLLLCGRPLLRLFGDEFVAGFPVLLVLLSGAAVNALCGSVGLLLNMTGHQREMLVVAVCSLGVNWILSLILIPRYGLMGTAVAFAVSMALWNVAMLLIDIP